MRSFFSLFLLLSLCLPGFSQSGHEITVNLNGYEEDVLYLAYHYGSRQYVKDTVYRQADNAFVFRGETALEPGNYMLVLAPDNTTFDFLIDEDEQRFGLTLDQENMLETVKLTNSSGENQLFFDYLQYLAKRRKEAEKIKGEDSGSSDSKRSDSKQEKRLNALNEKVSNYQQNLISDNPKSLTAAIVKASLNIDYPDFEGPEEEKQTKLWRYAQKHFFDNIDLADSRLLRTSLLVSKVDYFIKKLQVQHPDTINLAIDQVLSQMKSSEENYHFFVVQFLNEYARSKIVGMDAVYVHMAETYYTNGRAPWVESDQLEKILDNAARLKPLLIGKTAPNIQLKDRDGETFNLHDVEAEYTILYFWRYDCDHCRKSTSDLAKFYNEFKDKGVKMLAVCTKEADELQGCFDYADENELTDWIQASNGSDRNLEHGPYHVRSTPLLFILDKDKIIKSKRLGASQLAQVMEQLIK
ncbi:MAG: redoxin domain-containing protein [Roseivirga sp.]|nr:redoxin domain-containing protein [Roseivirga sp.]